MNSFGLSWTWKGPLICEHALYATRTVYTDAPIALEVLCFAPCALGSSTEVNLSIGCNSGLVASLTIPP